MDKHKHILNDPDVKASGLGDEHVHAIQTITDAIGHHTDVYDKLVKKFGEQPPPKGDLGSRVLQAMTLFQKNPAFMDEFEKEMDKHFTVTPYKKK